ncbi:MAG: cytidylyltransferase domain-containing protein [Roseburia sp.]
MKNIAIIPARSGSKGLKNKNIKLLNGKPLLAYTVEAALQSGLFDCVHVSTDSEQYADIAREFGADVPFLREVELASDTSSTWDALRFVIKKYEELGQKFDTVCLLQPTSPLRDATDIKNAYQIFEKKKAESVISVCETEHSPLLCNTLKESGSMKGFIDMKKVGRRQELSTYYRLNGAIYIQTVDLLMQGGDLYGDKSYAYVMEKEHSVDIDDETDFMFAEVLIKRGK